MNKEDLLKLLDLNNKDPASANAALDITSPVPAPLPPSSNFTVFAMDEWNLRRGRDLLDESDRLGKLNLDHFAIADFHMAAFDPDPHLLPDCIDDQRHAFLKQMLETPEYQALHASTQLDGRAALIAATAFAEQFAKTRKEEPGGREPLDREMETLRAVGRAVLAAREEVTECQEASAALGMGSGAPGSNDVKTVAALFRRVRGNANLRRICELAGKYRRYAQSKQRRKTTHGLDDVVGIELDGDLGRVLPSELARLALPEFELDALRRLVERQTMCRAYQATEPVAKGPIIVTIDESGSMEGEKAHTAKALALALAWIARQQRRWCGLVAYSGDSGERVLALPPQRWQESKLMDWLEAFLGGGSSIDVPVREMPRMYRELRAPVGDTDLIFITDAQCQLPDSVRDTFMAWKSSVHAKLITLVIGSKPGDLEWISDEIHVVRSLALEEAGIDKVLGI